MDRHGLLEEKQNKLNYVLANLGLTVDNFLECRLQTLVFKASPLGGGYPRRLKGKNRNVDAKKASDGDGSLVSFKLEWKGKEAPA